MKQRGIGRRVLGDVGRYVDDASETADRHGTLGGSLVWGSTGTRHSASGGRRLLSSSSPRERQVAERPLVVLGVERARAS